MASRAEIIGGCLNASACLEEGQGLGLGPGLGGHPTVYVSAPRLVNVAALKLASREHLRCVPCALASSARPQSLSDSRLPSRRSPMVDDHPEHRQPPARTRRVTLTQGHRPPRGDDFLAVDVLVEWIEIVGQDQQGLRASPGSKRQGYESPVNMR